MVRIKDIDFRSEKSTEEELNHIKRKEGNAA